MQEGLLRYLIIQFLALSTIVFVAGVYATKTTQIIDREIGLGDALGGMIILAFVTNL